MNYITKRTLASAASSQKKVAVVGAAGGIGQPLSLLMKLNPKVGELSVYDLMNTPGVAADLGHINTPANVEGFQGAEEMQAALSGADVVIIPAGMPRKPGMSRDDLFDANANIVAGIAENCAKAAPDACYLIISNPVNSTVPIFREVLKANGTYNKNKLFGVTTLDVQRANTFINELKGVEDSNVTVIGGHAGTTIAPLLEPYFNDNEARKALMKRIQFGGDEVVQAKASKGGSGGSATLSMAQAAATMADAVIDGLNGIERVECTFVDSPVAVKDNCEFFATPVTLGKDGVKEIHPIPALDDIDQENYDAMITDLANQVNKGVAWVKENYKK